jgi:thioredoxin-like negative regulator of GroEL
MNIVVLVLLFAILGLLVYKFWKPMIPKPKREVPKDNAKLYFFHVPWCGFCKKATPEWEALTVGTFGNTTVEKVSVDCESDKQTCALYEVEAYPTVKLETSTGLYEYKGAVTTAKLQHFLRSSLGIEKS